MTGVRRSTDALGDDAVAAATGQPRATWFALLDAQGATAWTHRDIAAWLVEEQGVDGWWAQSLTVAYEQERGLRAPGQRSDGTYEVSPSRSVAGTLADVHALVADDDARARWLDGALAEVGAGDHLDVLGSTPGSSVRLAWPAGALGAPADRPGRVTVGLYQPRAADGSPAGTVRVSVQHGGLRSADDVAPLKAFWAARLAALAALAEDASV
ncbi:hypothetical protein [Cellulosimicrobium marinum]|uniref:hypothetical protein n=1 Tax=Cellulosimicrobium marinum TaxID=1638992 RepID=UPI001E34F9DA|nr:hypothetical protein [Cellulosimicrobium marinum]MCB7135914.1 hypothetical protein [Cellulosimicrobium marinum]